MIATRRSPTMGEAAPGERWDGGRGHGEQERTHGRTRSEPHARRGAAAARDRQGVRQHRAEADRARDVVPVGGGGARASIRSRPRSARCSSSTRPTWRSTRPASWPGRGGSRAVSTTRWSSCARSCPTSCPPSSATSPNMVVEVDAMPGGYVCSASMKGKLPTKAVMHESVDGEQPLRKLFSKEQRAFFAAHAPDGVAIDDLAVLGPIFVLKLKLRARDVLAPDRRRDVAVPRRHPGGRAVHEVPPGRGPRRRSTRSGRSSTSKGIDLGGEQQTKTKTALEFFSAGAARRADLTDGRATVAGGPSAGTSARPRRPRGTGGRGRARLPAGRRAGLRVAPQDLRAGGRVLEDVGLADRVGRVGPGEVRGERREHDRARRRGPRRPRRRRGRAGTPTRAGRRRCGASVPSRWKPGATSGQPLLGGGVGERQPARSGTAGARRRRSRCPGARGTGGASRASCRRPGPSRG